MDWKEEFKQKCDAGEFHTDSDLFDFAEERNLDSGEVIHYLDVLQTIGTPCEKCKHIGFRYSMHPCNGCSRRPGVIDRYESE